MELRESRSPIVCLGIMVADVVGRPLNAIPDPGRLVLVDQIELFTGGCAINSATALAKLGLPVEVIGKIGDDPFGDFLKNALTERGIGSRGVKIDPEVGTSATMVMIEPDGERRFVHYIGSNANLVVSDIEMSIIEQASILHVAGSLVMPGIDGEPTANLLSRAREARVITFLDTVWDDTGRWGKVLEPCYPYIDYFVPSLPEAEAITGLTKPEEIASTLLDYGIGTVVLKMGSRGCLVANREVQTFCVPAYEVEVLDATGAGDAFAAGFIAGVYSNWHINDTALFANAVGALCVTGVGATGGVRSMNETKEFMQKTPLRKI